MLNMIYSMMMEGLTQKGREEVDSILYASPTELHQSEREQRRALAARLGGAAE